MFSNRIINDMPRNYNELFAHFKPAEPSDRLFGAILQRFQKEQRLSVIKRSLLFFFIFIGSAAAMVPAFQTTRAGLVESGFVQFFSLFFSDFKIVITDWQNFVFALLESLPAVSLAVFFITLLVFLESLKFLIKNIKEARAAVHAIKYF